MRRDRIALITLKYRSLSDSFNYDQLKSKNYERELIILF